MKIEMITKWSKKGPQNLILSASCTELKGEQLWCLFIKQVDFLDPGIMFDVFSKIVQQMSKEILKSGPKLTKFLRNGLIINPQGAEFG